MAAPQNTNDLEVALSKGGSVPTNFFPGDLEEVDHWVCFSVASHKFRRKTEFAKDEVIRRIFLPIPANLSTQYDQAYNTEGVGAGGVIGAQIGEGFDGTISSFIDRASSLTGGDVVGAAKYYGLKALQENIGSLAAYKLLGPAGGVAGLGVTEALKGALAAGGLAINPHMGVLYDGPNLRTHNFTYKFVPRNQTESAQIKGIIQSFRYHMAPGYKDSQGHFFDYPEQFDIDFHYPDYLFNIGPSVLKNLEINYHGEGVPMYHDVRTSAAGNVEKAPVSMTISMTFQEVSILTKKNFEPSSGLNRSF